MTSWQVCDVAQEAINIERLLSQARNPTHGQADKGIIPQRVFNLVPDRMGGYVPFGHRARLNNSEGDQVLLDPNDVILGIDETGITSFYVPRPEELIPI